MTLLSKIDVASIELEARRTRIGKALPLFNLMFACSSVTQDCVDELSELVPHKNTLKYFRNEYLKHLEIEVRAMQLVSDDEQLLALENCVAMRAIMEKIILSTKNGSIEELSLLILNFVPTATNF